MSTDPQFAATINNGAQLLGAAETSLTAPTTTSTLVTAGATGTRIEEVVVKATATTVAGLVYLFLYDGSTYHLFDDIVIAVVTQSTTVPPFRASKTFQNLMFKTGWSLRASQSISGNASLLKVHALGGDL